LNNDFTSKDKNEETVNHYNSKKCFDQPLSLEKKLISDYSSILIQNLKNNIKTLRETSSKSNRFDGNKSKSKEHLNTENITYTNLSTHNNNVLDTLTVSRQKHLQSSIIRLCEANKINYPLKIQKITSSNNNIFTMKEYKNNLNYFSKTTTATEKESKKNELNENEKYNTENTSNHYYYKPKQYNTNEVSKSNLKNNVKDAYDYVTNNNHINPLKFDFSNSGKKNQLNDMKYNAPKKDNFVKVNKEKTENNFKIKVERMYSNMTPENCRILITDNNNASSKKDLNSIIDKKRGVFLNMQSLPKGSKISSYKK